MVRCVAIRLWSDALSMALIPRDLMSLRDDLISRARYGEITPEQAEAEALANGLEPFACKPALPAFDPMHETRWTITMAIAWIAWRDLELVRENYPGIRSEWWYWIFREWNEPIDGGTSFARRAGWFLETRPEATAVWLSLSEAVMEPGDELPASYQMKASEAKKVLWRSLSQGDLTAEALNEQGRPTDIPAREWSYLKLFEDGKRDVLRYDALDRAEPFTKVKLKRDDLMRLWPEVQVAAVIDGDAATWQIEREMLQPLLEQAVAGFVPLCAAVHWIMTGGGARPTTINDRTVWQDSTEKLRALITSGEIELNGLRRGRGLTERIPGEALAVILILPPLYNTLDQITLDAPSHIVCTPYVDAEHWSKDFNDQLYERNTAGATWTHLQVKKSQVLKFWPRSAPVVRAQNDCGRWLTALMRESPNTRPQPKMQYWTQAKNRFRSLTLRQFKRAWDNSISESGASGWAKAGRPAKKSNQNTK